MGPGIHPDAMQGNPSRRSVIKSLGSGIITSSAVLGSIGSAQASKQSGNKGKRQSERGPEDDSDDEVGTQAMTGASASLDPYVIKDDDGHSILTAEWDYYSASPTGNFYQLDVYVESGKSIEKPETVSKSGTIEEGDIVTDWGYTSNTPSGFDGTYAYHWRADIYINDFGGTSNQIEVRLDRNSGAYPNEKIDIAVGSEQWFFSEFATATLSFE